MSKILFNLLKKIDNFTMRHAKLLVTLNEEMKIEIINRLKIQKEIVIVQNPSVLIDIDLSIQKKRGFSFTGNLGRFQRIPLLINAINKYKEKGGCLEFAFAGGGIFSDEIFKLSKNNSLVTYYGLVSSEQAVSISIEREWALLPIEDEITKFAFPSKISSYVNSGAKILAICGENTTVAKWIRSNRVGIVIAPTLDKIVEFFFNIEKHNINFSSINLDQKELKKNLHMNVFVKDIKKIIFPEYNV
jgi:hypothetical protein